MGVKHVVGLSCGDMDGTAGLAGRGTGARAVQPPGPDLLEQFAPAVERLAVPAPGGPADAHDVYDPDRAGQTLRLTGRKHPDFVSGCDCGGETVARPGTGRSSVSDGRKRPLTLTEGGLVGPTLATLIAALALRDRLPRSKIQEVLRDGLGLGVATIERCRFCTQIAICCLPNRFLDAKWRGPAG